MNELRQIKINLINKRVLENERVFFKFITIILEFNIWYSVYCFFLLMLYLLLIKLKQLKRIRKLLISILKISLQLEVF